MNIEFVTYWDIMFISKLDFDGLITRKFPMYNTEKNLIQSSDISYSTTTNFNRTTSKWFPKIWVNVHMYSYK